MHIELFYNYCLSLPYTEACFPFGPDNLVLKVGGKIYAITDLKADNFKVNLKANPDLSIAWRENFTEIQPGFHMNKKHWNTVDFEGNLSEEFLQELTQHSYDLVFQSLSKAKKMDLKSNKE